MPWILPVSRGDDRVHVSIRYCNNFFHVEPQVAGAKGREIRLCQFEEADRGAKAASVLGMIGPGCLLLKMNESSRELNESLEEGVIRPRVTEPEILQNIVCLVVLLQVEAGEIAGVSRVKVRLLGQFWKLVDECPQAVALFHRAGKRRRTIVTLQCVTRCV